MLRFPLSLSLVFLTAGSVADQPVLSLSWQTGDGLYRVNFVDMPCDKAMDELERLTGRYYLSKDIPDIRITFRTDEPVSLETLFDQLDQLLEPHGWGTILWSHTFSLAPMEVINSPGHGGGYRDMVSLRDLRSYPKKLVYKMLLDLKPGGMEEAKRIARQFDWFDVRPAWDEKIIVWGRVRDLQKFVAEMGDHIKK